jgi:hypothetical protein
MEPWSVQPVIRNHLDSKGWTVTVAIPLTQLLPGQEVEPGDRIYANVMRTRRFDGQDSWSWSPIFAEGYARSLHRMGIVHLAPVGTAGEVDVNGAFTSAAGGAPDGWVLNRGGGFDPHGAVTTADGWVELVSKGKAVHLYHSTIIPVHRGDRIVLEFNARGTGHGAAGVYFYAGGGDGAGSHLERFSLTPEPQAHTVTLPVANSRPDRFVAGVRPVLAVVDGGRAAYSQVRVRVEPRGR